jgi:putative ABC transport system permease protein
MEKLFGIPLPVLMMVLSGIFLTAMLVVVVMALRNSVMLKMGIRPISRRPGMTALIIIGVMLSTIIMAAAFGTADTLTSRYATSPSTGSRR